MTQPEAILGSVLAAIPLPALAISTAERIVDANTEARTLLGQQIVDRHHATILRQPVMLDAIEGCLRNRQPHSARYLSNDGAQDTAYDVSCRFVPDPTGPTRGWVVVTLQDVTQVEQAGQMRRDFVANVSHELRTPLTALLGFIETLRGPARNDERARERFLTIMEGEAGRMNRLVGDLLSLSRVESEERVRPRGHVDIGAQLASTLHTLRPLAEEAGVSFEIDKPGHPVIITGDADQVQQVITNLVENAIKYGASGKIVRAELTEEDHDPSVRGPSARLRIVDFGAGIDAVHLPRLTERFYRADNHRSRELGGTGLGLAIVKHIVNRHRGRLRVSSEVGKGSAFTVILPK